MNRSTAREEAFKIIFQLDFDHDNEHEHLDPFTMQLVKGVEDNKEKIDQKIIDHLKNWSFHRLPLVERTILRLATFELIYVDDIPNGVSINEAVELANKYGDEKSGKFVNGVLAKIIE